MLTRMGILDRLTRKVRAFRPVFANRDLRRVLLAFLLFGLAKWGFRISILVFAYERGGPRGDVAGGSDPALPGRAGGPAGVGAG
jgi:hypothetical protein